MTKHKDPEHHKKQVEPSPVAEAPAAPESVAAVAEAAAEAAAAKQPEPAADPVAEFQKKLDEARDKHLRAVADMDNFRKRTLREFGEIRNQERASTLQPFLNVFDHFQMALEHSEKSADQVTLKKGMDMILDDFRKALAALNVEPIDAQGKVFDPRYHQAVSEAPSADVPAGHVAQQWKVGYKLGEQLLRPAMVVVSSGAPAATAPPLSGPGNPSN